MRPLFGMGRIVATPGALEMMAVTETDTFALLERHASGDWGQVSPEDGRENERGLKHGFRLLSSYPAGEGRVWILTEADRSATTILLPSEY